ncbi:MAG: gliding motility-associated C-terminal domain-containing protein [Crocinitomicaceae bacterium]
MRYSLIFCVSLLVGFFIIPATAQKQLSKIGTDFNQPSAKKIDESIRCYTMEMDAIRRNQNNQLPSLQQQEVLFQKLLRDYKNGKSRKGENINKATLLTIPCIFHIITDGAGAEDISAAQVQAQVNQLNIDFRNLAGSNDPAAADVEIEFCLAILDPSDNLLPEQGINRVTAYGEGPFNTGFIDATIKPGTFWNPDEYMNVWVADITGGILGYAQFPSNSGLGGLNANGGAASTDGVVHLYSTIGSVANPFPGGAPYNLGRTMTHEVGHWLGLRHIWGDANCGNDFCGDTPQSQTSNFGCPNLTTCDGNQDMVENYMDYTNDACMDIFTADQKDRIRTVMLNSPRRALLPLSEKCGLPQPTISFVNPDGGTINEGVNCDFIDIPLELEISLPATEDATVTFTLGGNTTATQGVDFDITPSSILFPGNSTINQTFVITIYNDAILENNEIIELQINVTTIGDAVVSNTQGIYTLTILDANFVAANILFENFEGGALGNFTAQGAAGSDLFQNGNTNNASSQFWIIEPTNTTQFAFTNDDACDCDKSNDFLTSPVFSLVGYTGNVFLTFDHAFAAETYETAEVQINTGAGWNPISTLTNTSVNNANTLTTPWVNGNSLDLTVYVGQANVQIRFTYNDGGQWAYGLAIDNIRIYTDSPLLSTNLSGIDTQSSCSSYTWLDGNTYTTSNNSATYTIVAGASNGCDSLVTLNLMLNNASIGTDVLASCTPITWIDGNTYTVSNNTATFNIIGGAASGCDSIATLDLTINNTVLGTDTQVACESYIWIDGITYTASNNVATFNIANGAANGCDSIVTLDLTINSSSSMVLTETFDSGTITGANAPVLYGNGGSDFNQSYPISGTFFGWFNVQNGIGDVDIYERNLTNLTVGCTVTLSVWVRSTIPISDITMTLTDDNGSITSLLNPTLSGSWQLVTMTTTVTTNGLNFLVHYNSTGGNGLDVMMEDLTITQECGINAVINPVNDQCLGTNIFTFDGSSSISSAGVSSYSWDFGDASALSSAPNPIHTYLLAGAYDVILNISDGACLDDTTITVNVYASPIADAPLDIVACDFYALTPLSGGSYYSMTNGAGINYNIGDNITTSQSMYVFAESNTIPNCIDENTFMITINDSQSNIDSHISCGPFTWVDGITYTTSNNIANYTYTNGTSLGCDSTVTLDLTINTPATGTDVIASCAPITWIDGNTYTTSNNTSTFNLAGGATNGCDSLVSLDLTISNEVNGVDNQIACASFTWIDGITYTQSNNLATFTYTGGAVAGCDSIVTLNLTVNNPVITTDVQTSCDSYTWIDGNTYTEDNNTASYTYSGAAANTCDSIVNLNLTITYTASGTDFQTACDSYTWIDGNTYTASNNSATMNINGGATNGCDSIVTLNLIINNSVTSIDSQSACITFNWIDGNTYTQSNNTATFIISGGTINGCDSTVTLNLTINSLTTLDPGPDISVCEGQSVTPMAQGANTYSWDLGLNNGISFIPNLGTTEYTVTGTDINGCQSDASMIVNVNSQPSLDITSIDPLCAGDASGEINLEISDGTEPFTTLWSNDSNLNNQQNLFAGTFTVLVTDDEGCNEEGIVILSNPIEPCYELPDVYFYVPNSFTPDADEHNQNWFIVLSGVNEQTFTLNLYNRWGELIWESHDISAKWDGTYRGNSVPNGTYTWQIEYTRLNDGKRIFETGHLNVLR